MLLLYAKMQGVFFTCWYKVKSYGMGLINGLLTILRKPLYRSQVVVLLIIIHASHLYNH